MDIATAAALLAFKVAERVADRLLSSKGKKRGADVVDEGALLVGIEGHLREVMAWSQHVQFLGMNTPADTESSTIALAIDLEPRRFRASHSKHSSISERDLLSRSTHTLLLGEPGSGKTTTLKRVARRVFTEAPHETADQFDLPLVVRLRELAEGETLYARIATALALPYTHHEVVATLGGTKLHSSTSEVRSIETRIGDRRIEDVIPECLDHAPALLLLDGLDEVREESQARLRAEIVQLGRRVRRSKVVVSCRTGDYSAQMDGFSVVEICPLTQQQMTAIARRWLGAREAPAFLEALRRLPYFDLADRPLLLTQLLFLYKKDGYLPEQPGMIYRKLLRLLLADWDAQNDVRRASKYAGFDPDKKAEFLAALAFHVTFSLRAKSFSEDDLVNAYRAIYRPFNLPLTQAREVAKEIQTHTGIVVAGPNDGFEFCHLSLQEYLCANYLVRAVPFKKLPARLAAYSAPLAVAVTLSSRPAEWIGTLLLEPGNLQRLDVSGVASLLSRLLVERPAFEVSEIFGFGLLHLLHVYEDARIVDLVSGLFEVDTVFESTATALRWFVLLSDKMSKAGCLLLRLKKGYEAQVFYEIIKPPSRGALPAVYLPDMISMGVHVEVDGPGGKTRSVDRKAAEALANLSSWPRRRRPRPSRLDETELPL